MERDADVGGILETTADTMGKAIPEILLYIAVIAGISAAGGLLGYVENRDDFFGISTGFRITTDLGLVAAGYQLGMLLVGTVASYLLLRQFLGACGLLRDTGSHFWTYLLMSIVSGIGLVIGFVLLIIPGLILMVRWSAAAGFVIADGKGVTESLGKSWEATDGVGLSIFLAGLVVTIGLSILGGLAAGAASFAGAAPLGIPVNALAEAFGNVVYAAFGIAVYRLVAPTEQAVAEVFE